MQWIRQTLDQAKLGNRRALAKLVVPAGALICIASMFFSAPSQPIAAQTIPKTVSSKSIDTKLWVHIVGCVKSPGVYAMPSGSRLYEVVAAAGGFSKSADQASVNLARNITDGEQIIIRSTQDALGISSSSSDSGLVSINRASASTLETLPGVGPKLAARIVDWREANGGFSSIDQLRKVGGIGDKLFAGMKDLVSL